MMAEARHGLQAKLAGQPSPAPPCVWYGVVDMFTLPHKLL